MRLLSSTQVTIALQTRKIQVLLMPCYLILVMFTAFFKKMFIETPLTGSFSHKLNLDDSNELVGKERKEMAEEL